MAAWARWSADNNKERRTKRLTQIATTQERRWALYATTPRVLCINRNNKEHVVDFDRRRWTEERTTILRSFHTGRRGWGV